MSHTPQLDRTLRASPVVRLKGYDYFVHPLTDGIPRLEPELLEEAARAMEVRLPASFDLFLTPEAMGIPLATVLSIRTGKPFTVARKRAYGTEGEIRVPQRTGYADNHLHVHGLTRGAQVVVVDDVVSTGGTLRALAAACKQADARLVQALVAVNKGHDLRRLSEELGCPVESLVGLRVENGRVELV